MDQALRDLYQQSLITYEVGLQRSYNPREFEKLCAGES
jgi:Tfp pilus assembly pilus retraction ATPase PilT